MLNLDVTTTATDPISGVSLSDPATPETVYLALLYTEGRSETLNVGALSQHVTGKTYAETSFSKNTGQGVDLTLVVPFDGDHDASVDWLRARVRSRLPIAYKDNRGRSFKGFLFGLSITDVRHGSKVSLSINRVSYGGVL